MRIGGHDALEGTGADGVDVRLRKCLEQPFLTGAAHVVAAVLLRLEEDAEIDVRRVKQGCDLARHRLHARIEGGVVADEPKDVDRLLARVLDLERQILDPACPHARRLAHRVADPLDIGERLLQPRLDAALVDEVAPHVEDFRHVLDVEWADLHAGPAGGAGPDRLFPDGVAEERGVRRLFDHRVAKVGDQELRVERQAGGIGRASRLAASAFGARHQVEPALPVERGDRVGAARARAPPRYRASGPSRCSDAEIDVRRRQEHVPVLGAGNVDEEGEDRGDVHPVENCLALGWEERRWRRARRARKRQAATRPARRRRCAKACSRQHTGDDRHDQRIDDRGVGAGWIL